MKAFKKLMAAALVCVMALTMLTGCGVANNQTEKHMVEALNNAAKAAKVSYTYERTDALDKIADSAWETAKKSGKIADAEKISGDYVVYYKELDKTWNSVDKLKSAAEAAQKKFGASLEDKSGKKAVKTFQINHQSYHQIADIGHSHNHDCLNSTMSDTIHQGIFFRQGLLHIKPHGKITSGLLKKSRSKSAI